jgi:hypothetical protein
VVACSGILFILKSLLPLLQVHYVLKELVRKSIGETQVGYFAPPYQIIIVPSSPVAM